MTTLAKVPPRLLNSHERIVGKQHLLTLAQCATWKRQLIANLRRPESGRVEV